MIYDAESNQDISSEKMYKDIIDNMRYFLAMKIVEHTYDNKFDFSKIYFRENEEKDEDKI